MLPGIIQAQRSSGPTKSLRQSFGGKDFIKNDQVAPFHFTQFLQDFLEMKWKYSQGNRENILICQCFACSSEGWLDIGQEILFHPEFSHTTQSIHIAFILSQRINVGHKKQQLFKKTPSGSTSSKNPIVPIQTYTGWEAGEEQEFEQSSVSAVCAGQLIQHSQQTDPKRLHRLNQNHTFSPWGEGRDPSRPIQHPLEVTAPWRNYPTLSALSSARRH